MGLFKRNRRGGAARLRTVRAMSFQTASVQGVGKRERQEDAFAFVNDRDVAMIKERGLLALMADGMGGMAGGAEASRTVIDEVSHAFSEFDMSGDLGLQLEKCALQAGAKVYAKLRGTGGSTLAAALIFNEKLYFSSVGDSFVYLLRSGELIRLNREHNLRADRRLEAIEAGHMPTGADGSIREGDALTRFLGMPDLDRTDRFLRPLKLSDGDVIMLCSDGIGGVLDAAAITGALSGPSASASCRAMEAAISRAGRINQDNYTALVIRCVY